MSGKKKTTVAKSSEKKDSVINSRERTTVISKSGAAAAQTRNAPTQLEVFENAMKLFHDLRFAEARETFAIAATGGDRGISHRAALQMKMCERRLEQPPVVLTSAEDHYNYAVTQVNARNLETARRHLHEALALEPDADHVLYALALCEALTGDLDSAYHRLKRAIELRPQNRILAKQDTDFAPYLHQHPFDSLIADKN